MCFVLEVDLPADRLQDAGLSPSICERMMQALGNPRQARLIVQALWNPLDILAKRTLKPPD